MFKLYGSSFILVWKENLSFSSISISSISSLIYPISDDVSAEDIFLASFDTLICSDVVLHLITPSFEFFSRGNNYEKIEQPHCESISVCDVSGNAVGICNWVDGIVDWYFTTPEICCTDSLGQWYTYLLHIVQQFMRVSKRYSHLSEYTTASSPQHCILNPLIYTQKFTVQKVKPV